jgi:hypothetical protein
MPHWRKLADTKYLGSWDIPLDGELVLTIDYAKKEAVEGKNGEKENCGLIHFVENFPPLVANVTNRKMIAKVTGSNDSDDWHGKKIALVSQKVKAFGEVVDAIRVSDKKVAQDVPKTLTCADCKQPIKAASGFTAQVIADGAVKRYGLTLCFDCATKRKNAVQNQAADDAPPAPADESATEGEA